ncbi:hypothetical protein LINPERPRIM_LOCUS34733 [Linum perenne]
MEINIKHNPQPETTPSPSLFQGDEKFRNRVISRDSSVSSRVFYSRAAAEGGVPFNWETQPGTPKNDNRKEESIPPIGLPPAVLSLSLPKPCVVGDETKGDGGGFNVRKFKLLWRFFVGKGRSKKRPRRRCGFYPPEVVV